MARSETRGHRDWQRPLALAAIVLGVGLLGTAGVVLWQGTHRPPAYRYVMGKPVPPADLGSLAVLGKENITVRKATVVAGEGGSPLADLKVAQAPAGPVLVSWQSHVDDPFLRLMPEPREVTTLAPVLKRHVTAGEPVLAWWDSSREFNLLAGVDVAFGEHLGIPLFLPAQWRRTRSGIEAIESRFWKAQPDAAERARFGRFVDALLADQKRGIAELRKLAGGKRAVLVLHVRDVILLGELAPKKIGVAFRDFPSTGDVHGEVRIAYGWLNEHHYSAYTVYHPDDKRLRVIALTDKQSGTALAARLLPFVGNDQTTVPGTVLVYQTGGFWVYELTPPDGTATVSRSD